MEKKIIKLFDRSPIFKGTVLGLIFAGILFGFQQYYIYQIRFENPILGVFIADCPVAMCIFLLAYLKKFRSPFLNIFAFSSILKYGVTGTFLFFFTLPQYSTMPIVYIMFVSHLGMILSSLLLLRTPFNYNSALASSTILLLNDFVDIKFRTFSYLISFTSLSVNYAFTILVILSICSPIIYLFLYKLN